MQLESRQMLLCEPHTFTSTINVKLSDDRFSQFVV